MREARRVCLGGLGAEGGEVFNGENLLMEDKAELAGGLIGEVFQAGQSMDGRCRRGFTGENFVFKTGDWAVGDAAGVDEGEVAEVSGQVEGEAVGGDATGDVNADGADLAFAFRSCGRQPFGQINRLGKATPDAGEAADAAGRDAIEGAEADKGFFHEANEVDGAEA